jgi:hypothetical protein
MSEKQLREMFDGASDWAFKCFKQTGGIVQFWFVATANGEHFAVPPPLPQDPDASVILIRALFSMRDVIRYVFVSEAWTVDTTDANEAEIARRLGARNHPRRVEVVAFSGEDHESRNLTARRRIIRPQNAKPYLGPLEWDEPWDQSEGRIVGLLPIKGTVQ